MDEEQPLARYGARPQPALPRRPDRQQSTRHAPSPVAPPAEISRMDSHAAPRQPLARRDGRGAPAHAPLRGVGAHLPRMVEYVREDRSTYTLWDMAASDEVEVTKRRASPDPFPPKRSQPLPGALLLRLSGVALAATLLGGAPGAALGLMVAMVAFVRLLAFQQRAHSWSRQRGAAGAPLRLPSVATSERLRLVTALGQSLLALFVGGSLLVLLLTALR